MATKQFSIMQQPVSKLAVARYYVSIAAVYGLTLLLAWYLSPLYPLRPQAEALYATPPVPPVTTEPAAPPPPTVISGRPVRLVIKDARIDLEVQEGHFNKIDRTWSLSGTHANFATVTSLPNDTAGNTLLYGHNYPYVLGRLPQLKPGAVAQLFTDNGYVFTYSFTAGERYKPDDVSVFRYQGPPILSVQTCEGSWNQWRHVARFSFVGVETYGG